MKKFIKSVIFAIAMLCAVSVRANHQPENEISAGVRNHNPIVQTAQPKDTQQVKTKETQWLFVAFGEFQGAGGDGTTYIKITCKGKEGICFAFDGTYIYLRTQQGGYEQYSPALELIEEIQNGDEVDYYYSLP